jgi:hypothetical protein
VTGGTVELVGGEQFARTMHALADDLQHLDAAHRAAGAEVAAAAAGRARRKTGALAASFGPLVTDGGVAIGSPLRYAGVQEFGWSAHHITPSLALTSALADSASTVESIYTAAVDAAVGQVRGM